MRIWLIAENWPPRIGGIERYLTSIAQALAGHQVTVIAPQPLQHPLKDEGLGGLSVIRKRFFWPLWPKWLPLYLFLLTIARREQPDLIICGKALVEGRLAEKLKNKLGIPYIVCTYGMEIATWVGSARTRKQLQHVIRYANSVLYINERTKEELLALGVSEATLHVLYPCIDAKKLSQENSAGDVLKKYAVAVPYIISVARLVKRKGIDDLIQAFAELANPVRLLIVGDGPERTSLEILAKKLHANVQFLGKIPDADLYALYAKAAAFALTPKDRDHDFEGFGIVYLEAAFFGLPIIATRTGGVEKAVLDKETGILSKQGDNASIKDALQTILSDPILAKHYGKAGKERVLREFSKEQFTLQLKSIIEHI